MKINKLTMCFNYILTKSGGKFSERMRTQLSNDREVFPFTNKFFMSIKVVGRCKYYMTGEFQVYTPT